MAKRGRMLRIKRNSLPRNRRHGSAKRDHRRNRREASKQLEGSEAVKVLKSPLKVKSKAEIAKRFVKETDSSS